jgi:4-amino-4-deoxy-L-arabinose transferase-like glycosyltransferase
VASGPGRPTAAMDGVDLRADAGARSRFRRTLLGLTLAALAARVAFLLLEPATHPVADERTWTGVAIESVLSPAVRFSPLRSNLLFYPPVYPYFIATFVALFGTLGAAKWAQVVVSVLLVPAIGRVGRQAFGARVGLLAAAFAAFYPELVWYSVHFWCETVLLTLWWWAIERVLAADAGASNVAAAAGGLVFALAILTRETALYALPVGVLFLASGRPRVRAFTRAATLTVAALLVVGSWTYRNWIVFHAFVPVSTAGALALYQGNSGLSRQEVYDVYFGIDDEIQRYHEARRLGLQAIRDRLPWWPVEKLVEETPKFWETDSLVLIHITRGAYGHVSLWAARATAVAVVLPYLAVLVLGIAGVSALPVDRTRGFLLAIAALHFLLHVATHGFARYRLPVMPVVFLVAAWAALALWDRRFPRLSLTRWALALFLGAVATWVVVLSIGATASAPAFAG